MPGDISSKLCALRPCTENGGALVEQSLSLQPPGQGRDGGASEHHGREPPDKPQPGPQPRELLRNLEDKAESRDKPRRRQPRSEVAPPILRHRTFLRRHIPDRPIDPTARP